MYDSILDLFDVCSSPVRERIIRTALMYMNVPLDTAVATCPPAQYTKAQQCEYDQFLDKLECTVQQYIQEQGITDFGEETEVYTHVYAALLDTYFGDLNASSVLETVILYSQGDLDKESAVHWLMADRLTSETAEAMLS